MSPKAVLAITCCAAEVAARFGDAPRRRCVVDCPSVIAARRVAERLFRGQPRPFPAPWFLSLRLNLPSTCAGQLIFAMPSPEDAAQRPNTVGLLPVGHKSTKCRTILPQSHPGSSTSMPKMV